MNRAAAIFLILVALYMGYKVFIEKSDFELESDLPNKEIVVPTKEKLEESLENSWDIYCSYNECKG